MRPFFIIILGPTGVGKTDFSLDLARALSGEVINADMGQFYTALSVGTAKPAWRSYDVPHHLFDALDTPVDYSAYIFRKDCSAVMQSIIARNHTPIVVGGSGFYGKSLLYSVTSPSLVSPSHKSQIDTSDSLWQTLHGIDPQRASKIHPHDTYRIERALDIWRATGQLPSFFEPTFDPVGDCLVLFLDRDTDDLKRRIAQRAKLMIDEGWVQEVKNLSPAWRDFASAKLIGYREIQELVEQQPLVGQPASAEAVEATINAIVSRTNTYARRQRIFWRGLKKELARNGVWFEEFNLTLLDHTLYIKQLLEKISTRTLSGTDAKQ